MAKVNGHGGYWVVHLGTLLNLVVHNAEYQVELEADVRETRSAGCGGWTEGLPKVRRVVAATLEVAEDDASYPQVLGFTEGKEVSFWLRRGGLNQYDFIEQAIVRSVRVVNHQQRARRVRVACEHGRYTRDVTPPVLS